MDLYFFCKCPPLYDKLLRKVNFIFNDPFDSKVPETL